MYTYYCRCYYAGVYCEGVYCLPCTDRQLLLLKGQFNHVKSSFKQQEGRKVNSVRYTTIGLTQAGRHHTNRLSSNK